MFFTKTYIVGRRAGFYSRWLPPPLRSFGGGSLANPVGRTLGAPFCALFKKQTGLSPMRYLLHHRITRACAMLDSTDKPVTEIAWEVGFRDAFHFTKTFRAVVGSPPRANRLSSAMQSTAVSTTSSSSVFSVSLVRDIFMRCLARSRSSRPSGCLRQAARPAPAGTCSAFRFLLPPVSH